MRDSQRTTAAASRPGTSPRYQPEWVKPIGKNYRGHTLHEIPPNGQGIAALIALGILQKFDLAEHAGGRRRTRSTCRSKR